MTRDHLYPPTRSSGGTRVGGKDGPGFGEAGHWRRRDVQNGAFDLPPLQATKLAAMGVDTSDPVAVVAHYTGTDGGPMAAYRSDPRHRPYWLADFARAHGVEL